MPKLNDQGFYYGSFRGRLLGNKAREHLVLQELQEIGSKDYFLEVGCAQGHFEKAAMQRSKNVFGADYDFENLAAARKACQPGHFVGINAERLPFKSNSFDFVLCTEVLEHVPDWKLALKELERVSRRHVLITVPLEGSYVWRALSKFSSMEKRDHLHRLDSTELVSNIGNDWTVAKYEIVATPSRKLNRLIGSRVGEKLGIYTMLLLEKRPEAK